MILFGVIEKKKLNKAILRSSFDFECASFCQFALAAGWLAEDILAVVAGNNGLGMAEDDCGFVAASTFDVHEVWIRSRHEPLKFMSLSLGIKSWVQ